MRSKGFTLIELISIIIILGILASVAIPRYYNYKADAQLAAVKGTLGNVRVAIHNFYLNTAVEGDGEASFPTYSELTEIGTVLQEAFPENPYNGSNDVRDAVEEYSPEEPNSVFGEAGWAYDELSGKFWANSSEVSDL